MASPHHCDDLTPKGLRPAATEEGSNIHMIADERKTEAHRYKQTHDRLWGVSVVEGWSRDTYCVLDELIPHSLVCRISVYHYVTRSREDFEAKIEKGGGAGIKRKKEMFDEVGRTD